MKSTAVLLPIAVLVVGMASIQVGAAVAKGLFPLTGPAGITALRLIFATLILWAVFRPWRTLPRGQAMRAIALYGVALGLMNLTFYQAIARIPLGIAVALEFTGPLAVAVLASRRRLDLVWVALAAAGVLLLLPLAPGARPLDLVGVGFALAAAAFWAAYIVFGQKAGLAHGGGTVALGMAVAALAAAPLGVIDAGAALLSPLVLPSALAVAVLSSALPYSLEMFALTRLPVRTFGVLMSLEPALGALSGLVFLGERLSIVQWAAIACIMAASVGSAATARAGAPAPEGT